MGKEVLIAPPKRWVGGVGWGGWGGGVGWGGVGGEVVRLIVNLSTNYYLESSSILNKHVSLLL